MELNKCNRCGAFFVSSKHVCPNCEPKDHCDISNLKAFLAENTCPNSLDSLSYSTGISMKNLTRFLTNEEFSSISQNFSHAKKESGNVSIEL